jgi:dienelactone hydrolase
MSLAGFLDSVFRHPGAIRLLALGSLVFGAPLAGDEHAGVGDGIAQAPISMARLSERPYASSMEIIAELGSFEGYRSFAVGYDSDGLALRAVMNVPSSPAPSRGYPVVILSHGNAGDRAEALFRQYYSTDQRSAGYEELVAHNPLVRFAREGFVTLQPDYRGHGDSETRGKHPGAWQRDRHGEIARDLNGNPVPRVLDDDGLRFNGWLYTAYYTIDVLNLVAALSSFEQAPSVLDLENLFAWGRSLGGDVTARVLVCSDRVRAASLWVPATTSMWDQAHHYHYDSPLHADGLSMENLLVELRRYNAVYGTQLRTSDLVPSLYLGQVDSPVLIQVSRDDQGVRSAWGIQFHYELLEQGVPTELRVHAGTDHVFKGETYEQAVQADLAFFRRHME